MELTCVFLVVPKKRQVSFDNRLLMELLLPIVTIVTAITPRLVKRFCFLIFKHHDRIL